MDLYAPATTITQAYRNADPARPITGDHPWYVDLTPAREQIRSNLVRRFRMKPPGDPSEDQHWERVLFLSQRGTGKTTELSRIMADLRDRYEVVWITANEEVNSERFDATELLLIVALGVERHVRETYKRGLPREPLESLERWFAETTRTTTELRSLEAELGSSAEGGWKAFSSLVAGKIKFQSEARDEVVSQLRKRPRDLVAHINAVLLAAHELIRAQMGERELLVVVDNLDRYSPKVADAALVHDADHVRGLRANLVLTPPLGLAARPESEPITNLYVHEYMHTPRLRGPLDPVDLVEGIGRELLMQLLDRRVARGSVFSEPDAVAEAIIRLSGGSLREVLSLTQGAALHANGAKITPDDVDRAARKELSLLRLQVNTSGYRTFLGRVGVHKQLGEDPAYMDLLYRRWVLAYNGEDWFDLKPLLRRIPEVQEALKEAGA